MNDISKYIGSSEYWYAPVGVFAFIVLIAGLIGAWTGWKTALYFLVWNVVALVPAVLLLDKMVDRVNDNVDPSKMSSSLEGLDFSYVIHRYAGLIILSGVLLATNFLAFIFYWFFRSKLKRTIKENKQVGKSNAYARWMGVGVGVVTALPIAVFMTETASLASNDNGFTTLTGSLTKLFTGNKVDAYNNQDKQDLKDLIDAKDDTAAIDAIAKSFTGTNAGVSAADKAKAQDLLNNPILMNSITPEFISKQAGHVDLKTIGDQGADKLAVEPQFVGKVKDILKAVDPSISTTEANDIFNKLFVTK